MRTDPNKDLLNVLLTVIIELVDLQHPFSTIHAIVKNIIDKIREPTFSFSYLYILLNQIK